MVLTVKQVAERLNVTRSCVYAVLAARKIRFVRLGRRRGTIRIREEELQRFIQENTVPRRRKSARRCPTGLEPVTFGSGGYPNRLTTEKDQEAEAPHFQDPVGGPVRQFRGRRGAPRLPGPRQATCPVPKATNDGNTPIMFRPL